MTEQEIFDQSVSGVLKQFEVAGTIPKAQYHDQKTGYCCAIGVLLTDDERVPTLEGNTWRDVSVNLIPERLVPHARLLQSLQDMHDDLVDNVEPENFEEHFRFGAKEIAKEWGLEWNHG